MTVTEQNKLVITPKNTVEINGETYRVEEFSDLSLLHLLVIIRDGSTVDFIKKSNACAEIKEVIVPSISDAIILVNRNNKYICHLNAENFGKLCAELISIYYQRKYVQLSKIARTPEQEEEFEAAISMIQSLQIDGVDEANPKNQASDISTAELIIELEEEDPQTKLLKLQAEYQELQQKQS